MHRGFSTVISLKRTSAAVAVAAAWAVAAPGGAADVRSAAPAPAAKSEPAAKVESHDKARAAAHSEVHWSYSGETGPEEWGRLKPEFAQCYMGKAQSPVNIANPTRKDQPRFTFNYQPSKIEVINNGHTVQLNFDAGSQMEVDGRRYELQQVHFHSPSEHTVNGKRYPVDFHFVHKSTDGRLAVVGVMATSGNANAAYRTLLDYAPPAKGEERRNRSLTINAADLLPRNRAVARYEGSLTTPPCTEGVSWNVLTTPIELSDAQIDQLRRIYPANGRPLQKRYEREIVVSSN